MDTTLKQASGNSGNQGFSIILILALIGIAIYYFKDKIFGKSTNSLENQSSSANNNPNGSKTASYPVQSGFPLRFWANNANTLALQQKLNQKLKSRSRIDFIKEDGVLGNDTLRLIKLLFPTIGNQINSNQGISETQFQQMTTGLFNV